MSFTYQQGTARCNISTREQERIDQLAKAQGISRSAWVRDAVETKLVQEWGAFQREQAQERTASLDAPQKGQG